MDKLTIDEVMHISDLAKIHLTSDEIEKYRVDLKKLMDDIDKIKDVEVESDDIMIWAVSHQSELREDIEGEMLDYKVALENAPNKKGNFVEVPVMINE